MMDLLLLFVQEARTILVKVILYVFKTKTCPCQSNNDNFQEMGPFAKMTHCFCFLSLLTLDTD